MQVQKIILLSEITDRWGKREKKGGGGDDYCNTRALSRNHTDPQPHRPTTTQQRAWLRPLMSLCTTGRAIGSSTLVLIPSRGTERFLITRCLKEEQVPPLSIMTDQLPSRLHWYRRAPAPLIAVPSTLSSSVIMERH